MTRQGSDEYHTEHDFLIEMKAAIESELAHRASHLVRTSPDLAGQISALIETPIERWPPDADRGAAARLHALKLEERLLDDLISAIDQSSLVDAIERRIVHLEREEVDIAHEQPFGRYLLDSAYWRDDDALDALNRIFKNWARWGRSEPLEVP